LLNIPPDKRGLFNEIDVKALDGFAAVLKKELGTNLAADSKVQASNTRGRLKHFAAANLTDGNWQSYWATDDKVTRASVELQLKKKTTVKYIVLEEYIRLGQRVKAFTVETWKGNAWQEVASATTIGYKRILKIDPVETNKIRINIRDSKACPVLSTIEVY
jgi:alpha-L-fucosidase